MAWLAPKRSVRVSGAALALVLSVGPSAWAATPTAAIQRVFARTDTILTNPDAEVQPLERLLAIRKLVNEAFDFRSAAELASGDHWRARTAAEQEEFTWLFADLLERSFVSVMASRANLAGGTRIKYLGESIDGGTARVQTAMGRRDGGELLLDYRLIKRNGSWKVRDVAIDGVSMMANYRAQLDRVLGNASFPELLTQMRAMVGVVELPAQPAAIADGSPTAKATPTVEISLPPKREPAADAPAAPKVAAVDVSPQAKPAPAKAISLPVPTAVTPPPRVWTTRAYWLEVRTVETVEEAGRLATRLREGKFPVTLERRSSAGKLVLQVRVGPFRDAAEAVFQLLDLQTKGHDPSLVAERE
jgi:phospholipid transport system substrate-binding protein